MFRLRSDLAGSLRRQRMPEALAETFAGSPVRAVVDPVTRDVLATPPAGLPTRYSFDLQGFISSITTPQGRAWRFTSDKDGRATSVTNPGGSTAVFGYDPKGRLAQVSRDNQFLFHLQYDEAGNHVRALYPDSTAETLFYRDFEQLTAAMRRSGIVQSFEYDGQKSLTAIVDGGGRRTRYHYGRWSSPDRAVYPDGSVETYEYDDEGYLQGFSLGSNHHVSLRKNENGQPQELRYSDGVTVRHEFDDAGRRIAAVALSEQEPAKTHQCRWQYDAEGRVVGERSGTAEAEQLIEYTYDQSGQLSGLVYPGGEQVNFQWDQDGRLLGIRDWSGAETHWNYAGSEAGWVVEFPGRILAYTRVLPTGLTSAIMVCRQAETLFSLAYGYDAEDRVAACADSMVGQRNFAYDPDGRLVSAGNERFAFAYDAADNLTAAAGAVDYNAANQPTAAAGQACVHDDRGNLIQGPGPGGKWHFEWDARNRLVRADGPNWQTVTYGYDALGRRCWREDDRETRYIWAGETLIAEVELHNGQVVRRQEYLFIPGTTTLFATRINGRVLYAHCDHLGTPRLLTDAQGRAVWAVALSAWGGVTKTWGENIHQPWRFPGQFADETTGLHENRFRTYSPLLGRYLSRDPLGYTGGLNLYAYAGNDPINGADPLGLWGWEGILTAVAAVAVGVIVTATIIALAPVATAVVVGAAIVAGGAMAGAVAGGLNQALNEKEFCWQCIAKEALKGMVVGAVAALPFAFLPATAGVAAFAGMGGISGAIVYTGNFFLHPGMLWSWKDFALSVGIGAVTAGAFRFLQGRLFPARPQPEPERPPGWLDDQQLQSGADRIHKSLDDPIAERMRTTTVTQGVDSEGNAVQTVTSSYKVTDAQAATARDVLGPDTVIDDSTPTRPAPPDGSNHGEIRGINTTEGQTDRVQASSSAASHGGAACETCAQAQETAGVRNATGVQESAGGQGRTNGQYPQDKPQPIEH